MFKLLTDAINLTGYAEPNINKCGFKDCILPQNMQIIYSITLKRECENDESTSAVFVLKH